MNQPSRAKLLLVVQFQWCSFYRLSAQCPVTVLTNTALHFYRRYMYVSSCPFGANHTIVKADMDGKNPNVLVTLGESRPVGLVLDKANNRLYWIEKITKKIRYVQLNHVSQILTLQTLNFTVNHLEMTDILNYLYIVESGSWYKFGAVYRVDKTTGMVTKIVSSLWQPSGICGYSKTRQPPGW